MPALFRFHTPKEHVAKFKNQRPKKHVHKTQWTNWIKKSLFMRFWTNTKAGAYGALIFYVDFRQNRLVKESR